MSKTIYIYGLYHPLTNELRYIGKTGDIKRRLQSHIDYGRSKRKQRPVSDWINAILAKRLKPLIEIIETTDENNWVEREMYWIAFYKGAARLLNLTDGGESNTGYVYSNELREIRRKAKAGRVVPLNERKLIAATLSKNIACVDDNIIYPSMKDAIKASGVPKSTFHRKLHKGEKINNKLYEFSNN